ncbi:NPCBM/NEW2 domain-containing protein [Frigoriglobus tundricola]|nr:NPCBM/NEW2 domain-containing protein [Frigoriglobus tundricola]
MPAALRLAVPLVVLLGAAAVPGRAADADAVKEKLFQAKKTYDVELQAFRKAVEDHLNKREDEVRNSGTKKLVDQARAERDRFVSAGEAPPNLPPAVQNPITTARAALNAAYTDAVKEYVRIKEDEAAEAAENEQREFRFTSALAFGKRTHLASLRHYDLKCSNGWFSNNGVCPNKKVKYQVNGEFAPHSIFLHPPTKGTGQVKYPLGGSWTALRATVGVPKIEDNAGHPASALTFEVLGDGKSLWKSEPVTRWNEYQSFAVKVEKVKTLTLLVHSADQAEWARSVFVEPVLFE